MKELTILVVEPLKKPYVTTIYDDLAAMQHVVGGLIEPIYYDDCAIICNEEGKIRRLPFNRALFDDDGVIIDVLCGTFFVCNLGDENFASLSPKNIEVFSELFSAPEELVYANGTFVVIRHN